MSEPVLARAVRRAAHRLLATVPRKAAIWFRSSGREVLTHEPKSMNAPKPSLIGSSLPDSATGVPMLLASRAIREKQDFLIDN